MASLSNVPAITWSDAGLVLPTEADILAGVQADIDAAFGGGLNPALETPQGQLASSQAAVIGDKNAELAQVVNNVDPLYSAGRWQDALGRIYFLNRKGATATVVTCTLVGIYKTVIPAGTLAMDADGNKYVNLQSVSITSTGTASAEFANIVTGPIPCPAGSLTQIYQAIPGWDSISNPGAGVLGADAESRTAFEYRRRQSVSANAHGSPQAIYGEVFDVDGVLDCYVQDNPTGSSANYGFTNKTITAHSVYVAVVGGTDADIAAAIWRKKDLGCDMVGNTIVNVSDDSGYSYPPPTYQIKFHRPIAAPIKFNVSVNTTGTVPSWAATAIKDAIIARFNGADGTARERIGATVFASRYYSAVAAAVGDFYAVTRIVIGRTTPLSADLAMVGIDEVPTVTASDITITIV